jgi:hypothetical protein
MRWHVGGRIHDARIDIAEYRQVEQVRAVLGVVEGVCRGLVNGYRDGVGGRIRAITRMYRFGFDFHVCPLYFFWLCGSTYNRH